MRRVQKNTLRIMLVAGVVACGLVFATSLSSARRSSPKANKQPASSPNQESSAGKKYYPQPRKVMSFAPVNLREIAAQEALEPQQLPVTEVKSLDPPKGDPPKHGGAPILLPSTLAPDAIPPSPTGISPGPTKTFKATESLAPVIPPDTDGAVGSTHIVSASNDRLRIFDRNGVILSTVTTNSFWSGLVLEGGATPSITDPRVRYDRFNNRFIFALVANPQTLASATLIAVTATNDPTGTWFRYAIDTDPTATATGGMWADFPSIGFNKDFIVVQNNLFGFGSFGTGYQGPQILAIDKATIYTGPGALGAVPTFFDSVANCTGPVFEPQLGCGFTMSPSVTEDNTTPNVYLVEDWDTTAAQLRITKLSGPVAAPVLTVGTQIPQSVNSWRFNATRIQTTGGYLPQHQQSAHLVSGTRMMANDSRMQNVVYRNGSLWAVHHVMIATTPTAAGVQVGGGAPNPADNHTAIQWWQMDPSIETGLSTVPTQRARIEDPTADNCHDGNNGLVATPPCSGSAANQHGTFVVFPSIAVNQNNDVLIGFSQFGALHFPSAAYAYRANTDPINTMRDPVVYRPGQSNDNLGAGAGAARQNRWGDYSMTQTDPLNDTDFWTVQEYTDQYRDFGIGVACPWATWWALVRPSTPAPSTSGSLIISEFRLRGPQGVRDEFVEVYNPGTTPIVVNTTDNSDGWALAFSTTAGVISGVATIPNGTVIPAKGHFLFADDPDSSGAGGLPTVVYSLAPYPGLGNTIRNSDSDTGWAVDLPDNGGLALFKTATVANFNAANRMDSVGFVGTPVGLFKEGAGIPNVAAAGLQQTFFRNTASGEPKDTGDNVADFIFADPAGTLTTAGQRLGAPGPENLDGPIHGVTGSIGLPVFDNSVSAATAPNFVFDPTAVPNGTAGTITVRRRLVNNTGAPLSRVRLRFVDLTTLPQPVGTADLRVLNSSNVTVETPPAQALGGGLNSSVAPPVVTLATPIANGANTPIDLVFGVMQTGCFHFIVIAEAPGGANTVFGFGGTAGAGACSPTAAPANLSGTVTTSDGSPLAGVSVDLSGFRTARTITDSNGNYHFNNIDTNRFYTVTPSLVNYHFGPVELSFSLLANKSDASFTATHDAVSSGNAIDTPEYFVRQHYLDFLGREPDQSGFDFWSNQIRSCADAQCTERRIINVSAAYFLSIEFQETGGLVEGLYRASYGRRPLYAEFMPDTAAVAHGVRVGDAGWAALLDANKEAFVADWIQRPAFQAAYGGLANEGYVDTLISHTGVSFTHSERDALVSGLNNGSLTRATALRRITEDGRFVAAKRNEAFVMMEYFGYLRRDPDEAGYRFWLNKLNQFHGNFEQAEMVKSFLVSGEYRARFGR